MSKKRTAGKNKSSFRALLIPSLIFSFAFSIVALATPEPKVYLPVLFNPVPTPTPTATPTPSATPTATATVEPTPTNTPSPTATPDPNSMVEFRGVWVSRFDWTNGREPASQAKIDEIIENVSFAGFNAIYFQVRGTGDAFYNSAYEPWAQRVTGVNLGDAPTWDPLAYFIWKAKAVGIDVHAYINVYPSWHCNDTPSADTSPQHIFHQLKNYHGTTTINDNEGNPVEFLNGLQWLQDYDSQCLGAYQRVSPASIYFDTHLTNIVNDIASKYDVDGIHLDHIRYAGRQTSCDPVSLCRYNGLGENCGQVPACIIDDEFKNWQRQQVNGTVEKVYRELEAKYPDMWLSAAVWPIHTIKDEFGWERPASQGFHDYYQDSKGWQAGGYIDSISPMIYSNAGTCPEDVEDTFWTRDVWRTLVDDFELDSSGRHVVPGIGGAFCDFEEINWRIQQARQIGTSGYAIFSYSYLNSRDFWDEFANGPNAIPAVMPDLPWRP